MNCVKTFSRALAMCYPDYKQRQNLEIVYQSVSGWDKLNDFITKLEEPCIVNIGGIIGTPPKGHLVLKNTQNLTHKSSVISTASLTNATNISYPNSFSISVGNQNSVANDEDTMELNHNNRIGNEIELQSPLLDKKENQVSDFGPYLDFQCPAEYLENERHSCAASDFVSGVVASLFIRAAVAGILPLFFLTKHYSYFRMLHLVIMEYKCMWCDIKVLPYKVIYSGEYFDTSITFEKSRNTVPFLAFKLMALYANRLIFSRKVAITLQFLFPSN